MGIKLSIITPTFNSEKSVRRTIESVQNQKYTNYEHIIVDGLSNDSTVKIVKEYMKDDPHIRLISEKDHGIYDAMNKGIRLASGDLIGIINSDDYYEKDAFIKILKAYDERNKYQVIYGELRKILNDEEYMIYCYNYKFINRNMITHPTCFVTKETYNKFGMFDESYRLAADYDFMIRLVLSGKVKFIQINDIIANYTMGGASGTQKSDLEALNIRKKYGFISNFQFVLRWIKIKIIMLVGNNKKY